MSEDFFRAQSCDLVHLNGKAGHSGMVRSFVEQSAPERTLSESLKASASIKKEVRSAGMAAACPCGRFASLRMGTASLRAWPRYGGPATGVTYE